MNPFIQRMLLLLVVIINALPALGQGGVITGRVTNQLTNAPIPFANVLIPETGKGAVTDSTGAYRISGLSPGLYTVQASYIGFKEKTVYEIQVTNSKPAEINFALEARASELEEVVVRASPFKQSVESPLSLRTIGVAEIQRNPGGNRDISRVIQTLPGVTSTVSFRNDLIVRGGAPNENRFFLDGVEVPNINHFATQGASGGPVGLINVNFIREVDFYSGAFPANRGNTLSSVLEFQQRDGRSDRLGGTFMLSATDFGLTLEGPIGERTTFLLSARRSYLQFLFDQIGLPFLPTYNDFQSKVKFKIDQRNEITFIGLGAIDQFELNTDADDTEEKQFILDQIPVSPQWNYATGLVYKHYRENGYWTVVASRNVLNNRSEKYFQNDDSSEENLILDYESEERETKFRLEHTRSNGAYKLNYGLGYQFVNYRSRTFNRTFTSSGPETIDFSSDFNTHKYALFGQVSRQWLNERLSLSLGFRLDGTAYSPEMENPLDQFSPRFSLSYSFTDRIAFNFNTGIYYQLPPYTIMGYQEGGALVNRENGITYIRNNHLVAGLEYNTGARSRITVEGYYKKYDDYPFLLRDSLTLANLGGDFGVIGNEPAVSRSGGRTYGMEVLFQQRLFEGFYGIAAYTLGWSEFEDKNGELAPSSWDARHILNLTAGKKFGKNWEIGINWRFQSALPYTPFDEDSALRINWDVTNQGLPDYDRLNTRRLAVNNTIDIRIDKKWFFDNWSLNLYLDIENITGNAPEEPELLLDRPLDEDGRPIGGGVIVNPEAPLEEQRYQLKMIDTGQGTIIPSIGVMVEL